eukprot:5735680-Alexandrium_andersonii.AAC.1
MAQLFPQPSLPPVRKWHFAPASRPKKVGALVGLPLQVEMPEDPLHHRSSVRVCCDRAEVIVQGFVQECTIEPRIALKGRP